jgi:amidophosphoribosyltransferase
MLDNSKGDNIKMCGIAGVHNHPRAARLGERLLFGLQHRGQESAGQTFGFGAGKGFCEIKGTGLVADVFTTEVLHGLDGMFCICHTRYSTAGSSCKKNAQPLTTHTVYGEVSLAHNGNLTNAGFLRQKLEREKGAAFVTESDSEVILQLIAHSGCSSFSEALYYALTTVEGAFALVIMHGDSIYGVCDPYHFRPLWLGRYEGSYVLSSEDCALDLIGAERVRELEPGEILEIGPGVPQSKYLAKAPHLARCIFEHVYFSRPDSLVFGRQVYESREQLGRELAREQPASADVVIPVPDGGVPAADGYAQQLGIRFVPQGLVRNHYVGRTFINPDDAERDETIRLKLNPLRYAIKGKRVVLVDDSIVRGATSRQIVRLVRQFGATEVHFRVSSPPIISPCFWGIDTPTSEELIAYSKPTPEAVRKYIQANTLGYLSLQGMLKALASKPQEFCTSCFTGICPTAYPVEQLTQIQ